MRAHLLLLGTENNLDLTSPLTLISCLSTIANSGKRVSCVLKRLHRIKEKRGLMILKIFLGMEWMLILGGDVGLYVYLVVVVGPRLFGLRNCKANGNYAFLPFLSSALFFPRCAVLKRSLRAAMRSMTTCGAGDCGATVISRPFTLSSIIAITRLRRSSS